MRGGRKSRCLPLTMGPCVSCSLHFIRRYILGALVQSGPSSYGDPGLKRCQVNTVVWFHAWRNSTCHSAQFSKHVISSYIDGQLPLHSFCHMPGTCAESFPHRKQFHQFSFHRWKTGSERLTLLKSELGSGPPTSEFIPHCFISPSTRFGGGDTKTEAVAPRRLQYTDDYSAMWKSALETQKNNWFVFFRG